MTGFKFGAAVAGLTLLTIVVGVAGYFFIASVWVGMAAPAPTQAAVAALPVAGTPTAVPSTTPATAVSPSPSPSPTTVPPRPTKPAVSPTPTPAPDEPGILIIPALELHQPVTLVPVRDGQWDISELGSQIGRLQTTGSYPGDAYAMTFTGHVTRPWPEIAGPFADLVFLKHGEEVIYRWQGVDYVYEVERIFRVDPRAVDLLYVPDGDKIVLVTCSGWDFVGREYAERLVTRATLVRTEPAPVP